MNFTYSCDDGFISSKNNENLIKISKEIGEIIDLYCVVINKKPIAAFDFSSYGRQKLKKLNMQLINQIIESANNKNIICFQNTRKKSSYLKSVFCLKKNIKSAILFCCILDGFMFDQAYESDEYFDAALGILLGYSDKNIKYFIKERYSIDLKNYNKFKKYIDKEKKNISLQNLPENWKMLHHIKKI